MAQLTVRGVDDDIVAALKARAAKAGRSAEAEHRKILSDALRPDRQSEFFEIARARRVRLASGSASSTEMLRESRDRQER